MAHKYIIDTHALVWFVEGNKRLGESAKTIIGSSDSQLVLPLIALVEAAVVIERGRTTISDISKFLARIYADTRIEIFPLTLDIFERSLTAEGKDIPELHDRLIVCTGLFLQDMGDTVEIITKDQAITKASVLKTVW